MIGKRLALIRRVVALQPSQGAQLAPRRTSWDHSSTDGST